MTTHRALLRFALLSLLAGCGDDPAPVLPPPPALVTPQPAPEPVVAPPPPAQYTLHEWGLIGVETGSALGVVGSSVAGAHGADAPAREQDAAARVHRQLDRMLQQVLEDQSRPLPVHHPGLSGPHGPATTGKPVIYLHVPSGAPPVDVAIALRVPASQIVEHWPAAAASDQALTWNVRATNGACTAPAAAPTATDATCTSVRDGFCEAAEIPRYHGQNDTCVTVGDVQVPLLFYRGNGTDVSKMPLALRTRVHAVGQAPAADAPTWEVARVGEAPVEGPVLLLTRVAGEPRIHALRGPDYTLPAPTEEGISAAEARSLLHDEAVRRGLAPQEAEAFVDAWAPAYFGESTRQGPAASGTAPATLAAADRSLLYFAPESLVDQALPLELSPPPTARHRVFLVRYVDTGASAITSTASGPAPSSAATPRLQLGNPSIRGSLAPALVRRVAQGHQAMLLSCYERTLARAPNASGAVTVQYVINPTGAVSAANVAADSVGDAELGACMVRAIRSWTHPFAEGITAVRYPFQLTREE